ncbi:MAG TPA: polymer-forming cytoskeletal protein [Steroidobacteraceae bacterium]|nr:polymer-forming cytoskeletal protein [Steroidobacteraceae bacterium]
MLHSNQTFDRGAFAERPTSGPPGVAGQRTSPGPDAATTVPVLGKTLLFRGELTAEEDVILQGRVEGSIRHARNLIIGTDGSVLGDVYASHLTVEGLVEGDLYCSEAVVVRATAQVRGNIFAPRVGIMEGATFNGRVEMDPNASASQASHGNARQPPRQAGAAGRNAPPAAATPPRAGNAAGGARVASAAAAAPQLPAVATTAPLSGPAVDQLLNPGQGRK